MTLKQYYGPTYNCVEEGIKKGRKQLNVFITEWTQNFWSTVKYDFVYDKDL